MGHLKISTSKRVIILIKNKLRQYSIKLLVNIGAFVYHGPLLTYHDYGIPVYV